MDDLKSLLFKYAMQNIENLEIAFETPKVIDSIIGEISKLFREKLKDNLLLQLNGENWIFPKIENNPELTFLIKNKNWKDKTLCFGINDFADNDKACYVVGTNDNIEKEKLYPLLQNKIQGKYNQWWWYLRLKSGYNRWKYDIEVLKVFYQNSNELINEITNDIIQIKDILDTYNS